MSFVIMQAMAKRLEERRKTSLFAETGSTMKLPRSGHGRLGLEVIDLADRERPPMVRIPEYLEKRRSDTGPAPMVAPAVPAPTAVTSESAAPEAAASALQPER
jgi:hypothetical protein